MLRKSALRVVALKFALETDREAALEAEVLDAVLRVERAALHRGERLLDRDALVALEDWIVLVRSAVAFVAELHPAVQAVGGGIAGLAEVACHVHFGAFDERVARCDGDNVECANLVWIENIELIALW